ncbi:MAG: hypothetical protein E7560_02920 [Ruminococcaceae bacterium]|nr:hypothetical protein [Oscillospiraceae bacterium]
MFYCDNCGAQFEEPKKVLETHGNATPPYEKLFICPFCKSCLFHEKSNTHCRCCGAKLKVAGTDYCSDTCRQQGIKLREKERKRKRLLSSHPINEIIRQLEIYNKEHNTNYSYGQFVALILPKKKARKCAKRKKNI